MEAQDYVLALKQLKLTQMQISEGTGIPQPTISRIERGSVSDVKSRHYRALQSFHEKVDAARSTKNAAAEIAGTDNTKAMTPPKALDAAGRVAAATEALQLQSPQRRKPDRRVRGKPSHSSTERAADDAAAFSPLG